MAKPIAASAAATVNMKNTNNVTINNKEILGDSVDIESIFYGTQYGKKTIK